MGWNLHARKINTFTQNLNTHVLLDVKEIEMLVTTLNKRSKFTTYCLTPAREVGVVSSCMLCDSCKIRIYCIYSTAPKTTIPIQRRSVRRKDFAELVIVHFLCKIYRELNYPSLSFYGRYTLIKINFYSLMSFTVLTTHITIVY